MRDRGVFFVIVSKRISSNVSEEEGSEMYTDKAIVELFWERDEDGIVLLQKKYGQDLTHISYHILNNLSDAEECVNDTYLRTWNSIPKARPNSLLAYTGKIIRNLSIDQLKKKMSKKREYRYYFIERYWYAKTTKEIAEKYHATDKKVEMVLYRCRKKLRLFLVERGYSL